jgi:Ni,Fe-hydrogenase III large subunit
MTETKKVMELKRSNTGNAILAGLAGVVAGGVAVATAVVMSDKKNQKKVHDTIEEMKEKVVDYVETIKSQPAIETGTQKIKKAVEVSKQKIVGI